MRLAAIAVLSLAAVTVLGAPNARADNPLEVESARAHAKFGYVLDDRDIELLRRYGCYSRTDHPVCDTGREYERHLPRKKKKRYVD
jgi:hypothetical protein